MDRRAREGRKRTKRSVRRPSASKSRYRPVVVVKWEVRAILLLSLLSRKLLFDGFPKWNGFDFFCFAFLVELADRKRPMSSLGNAF